MERAVGDAPRHPKRKKSRTAGLGIRKSASVKEVRSPEAVGALKLQERSDHQLEHLDVIGALGVVGRQVVEDAGDAGHDPTVAPGPIGVGGLEVDVAPEEVLRWIEEESLGVEPHRV